MLGGVLALPMTETRRVGPANLLEDTTGIVASPAIAAAAASLIALDSSTYKR